MINEIGKEELQKLIDVTKRLTTTIEYEKLLEIIIESAKDLTNSEASSLLLIDEKVNKLHFAFATGEAKDKLLSLYIPLDEESIAGSCAKRGEPVVVKDVNNDPHWYSKIDEKTRFTTSSILAVPLKLNKKTIGVLEVLNKKEGTYTDEDINLLMFLAEQAAQVLENAKIYKKLLADKSYIESSLNLKYKIVGTSEGIQRVLKLAEKVANTNTTVLLLGESGSGKELFARFIHRNSGRAKGPFISINCAAIPSNLIESELFGYEKGAFTGANQRKLGRIELAHKGTLFLDEIGDLTPDMQVKILRFLEEREFERLGGKDRIKVNVRIITATNQKLTEMVREKTFREDLYFRISVFPLEIPPLRQRKEDIPLLVNHFIDYFNREMTKGIEGISASGLNKLISYDWPGNVRELRNVIERAFVMSEGKTIKEGDLILPETSVAVREEVFDLSKGWIGATLDFKRRLLLYALERAGGNNREAAKILRIQPSYLSRLKKELQIEEV